jgi:orotidine-5'-phosphate decarboxylase
MNFYEALEKRVQWVQNPVCFGMDPVLKLIPAEGNTPEEKIRRFYFDILEEMLKRGALPAVCKPNSAYYESVSVEAMQVLAELCATYSREGVLVILDAKRGDIGKSSAAYAQAAFGTYGASAVTASPWMGEDSVKPFLDAAKDSAKDSAKGVYALLRTSNKGAKDFQDLPVLQEDGTTRPAYFEVAQKLLDWGGQDGAVGAVVGATNLEELEKITQFFAGQGREIPFLIPGVSIPGVPGGQGGDAREVLAAIGKGGGRRKFHVLNSSSGLNYAWQAKGNAGEYATACVDALERLRDAL